MKRLESRPVPTPKHAVLLFAAVWSSNWGLNLLLLGLGLDENWMIVSTPLGVLFWTGLAAWYFRVDLKETFLLRLPSANDVLMAVPLAFSFIVLNDQLSSLTDFMITDEMRLALLRVLRADGPLEWIFKLSTIAVGAAVSEELLCRGFLQSGLGSSMSRSSAVIWTAFLFMALHALPLPSIAAAGLVLGFVAVATRSIVVPILIHFLNNAAALALVNLTDLETLGDPVWTPAPILVPAVLIFVLTMGFFARRIPARSHEIDAPKPEGERGGEPGGEEHLVEVRPAPAVSDEFSSIPADRRRLGWVVVAAAVVLGASVLLALSAASLYLARPQSIHAALIEAVSQQSLERLSPRAYERRSEIENAFASLSAVNEAGSLSLGSLMRVVSVVRTVSRDGSVEADEVDELLDAVRETVRAAAAPRRL